MDNARARLCTRVSVYVFDNVRLYAGERMVGARARVCLCVASFVRMRQSLGERALCAAHPLSMIYLHVKLCVCMFLVVDFLWGAHVHARTRAAFIGKCPRPRRSHCL